MPPTQKANSPKGSILALSSEVGVGAVGLSLARFVFAREKLPLVHLPTVFFAARPGLGPGALVPPRLEVPADHLAEQLEMLEAQGFLEGVRGVLTGYFASPGQIRVVASFLQSLKAKKPEVIVLVDPILGDFDCGLYVEDAVAIALRETLLPLSHLITPNLFEFLWLAGALPVEDASSPELNKRTPAQWLALLSAIAPPIHKAVVTSAEIAVETGRSAKTRADGRMKTVLIERDGNEGERNEGKKVSAIESRYFNGVPKGTGDAFAAILLSRLVSGDALEDGTSHAVRRLEEVADKARGMTAIEPYLLL